MKDLGTETEDARLKVNNFFDKNLDTGSSSHHSTTMPSNNQGGVTGAVTTVTGTVSNRPCALTLVTENIAALERCVNHKTVATVHRRLPHSIQC